MNKRRRYKAKRRRRTNKLIQQGKIWQLVNGSTIEFGPYDSGELLGSEYYYCRED